MCGRGSGELGLSERTHAACLGGIGRVSGAATGAVDAVKPWRACHR